MGFSKRKWCCPYFTSDEADIIRCRRGRIPFPDRKSKCQYAAKYCGSAKGWCSCTLAKQFNADYERMEEKKHE